MCIPVDVINSEHGRETISNGKLYFITDVKTGIMGMPWGVAVRRGNPSSNGLEMFVGWTAFAARIKIHSNNTVC